MRALALGLLVACTPPARIRVPAVRPPASFDLPVAVEASAPVDARPPGSRADGGLFDHLPLPVVTHGDLNLSPHPIDAVDRLQRDVLAAQSAPSGPAPWRLHLVVRDHAGRREASGAWWVSKVTAGLSGIVGGLVIPGWISVDAVVDAQLYHADGHLVAQRRIAAHSEERRAITRQSPMWSLWIRRPARGMMTRCIVDAHQQLADGLAAFLVDATGPFPPTAAFAQESPPLPALLAAPTPSLQRGAERAHPLGGPMDRGQVLGRIGLPALVSGYDAAVSDDVALLFDVSAIAAPVAGSSAATVPAVIRTPVALVTTDVAALHNAFGGGLRVMTDGPVSVGAEGIVDVVLTYTAVALPTASFAARPSLLVVGGTDRAGIHTRLGAVWNIDGVELVVQPGAELQISRSVAVGLALLVHQPLAPWGPTTGAPQVVLGLR